MASLYSVVVRPLLTEKSNSAYQDQQVYTFEVHPQASKGQIKAALEKHFGVTVTGVRTIQMRRNAVRRGLVAGVTNRWKKAYVTLKDGDTLPVFEG